MTDVLSVDEADAIEFMFEQGWTDGLPVVPPTPERVGRFLDAADPVTLLTWWRAHPASSPERLLAVLRGDWEEALPPTCGRRLIVARGDWHAGRRPPSADVVEVITFDGLAAATSFLDGPAQQAGPLLAGVAFGAERHLARPVVIV